MTNATPAPSATPAAAVEATLARFGLERHAWQTVMDTGIPGVSMMACGYCAGNWPCETYRMAQALATAEADAVRVEALEADVDAAIEIVNLLFIGGAWDSVYDDAFERIKHRVPAYQDVLSGADEGSAHERHSAG